MELMIACILKSKSGQRTLFGISWKSLDFRQSVMVSVHVSALGGTEIHFAEPDV